MATATKPIRKHRFHLPIRTEEALREYVRVAFGIRIPDEKVCAGHTTPWRAFADAYFARSPVTVWKASRGFGGKSFLLSLLGMVEAQTLRADVNVLGGSGEQSERVLEHMTALWDAPGAPRSLLVGDVRREQRIAYGNKIRALMASSRSVRGPHPQRIRLDEVDEMDIMILDAALGQTMATPNIPAQTVLSSTHHYPDKTMTEVLNRAYEKEWPVYEWCWRETSEPHGWLMQSEVERKRVEIPTYMWLAEYDLQEPSPQDRAIDTEAVDAMFDKELGEFDGLNGEYVELDLAAHPGLNGHGNYTGADWARKQDRTEIGTLAGNGEGKLTLVAYEQMNRLSWPHMVSRFDAQVNKFKSKAAHDGTGIGDVVDGYLSVQADSVIMVGQLRRDIIANVISAIERGEIKAPYIRHLHRQLKYVTNDDIYGSGHLPDGLAMLALAYKAASIQPTETIRL